MSTLIVGYTFDGERLNPVETLRKAAQAEGEQGNLEVAQLVKEAFNGSYVDAVEDFRAFTRDVFGPAYPHTIEPIFEGESRD